MGDNLLVRSYNVGCGDCTYVRIPNADEHFHILIDCGSKESARTGIMRRAIAHLEEMLPPLGDDGKKRLDLVVVTHRHEDHIKGFNPDFFENIQIENIWITAGMNDDHPQAQQSLALHNLAASGIQEMVDSGLHMQGALNGLLSLYSIGNVGATTALTDTLPERNGIAPQFVYAGKTSDDLGVSITGTKIHVLAPEQDIDGYYLGEEADATLRGLIAAKAYFAEQLAQPAAEFPANISEDDFRTLRCRTLSNRLAFAVEDSSIQNNVSTVLLIEWRNRRLLFLGDAEWYKEYKEGRRNGSWNVMWKERRELLAAPLDFLKLGHHGSHTATPWAPEEDETYEANQILDAILPLPPAGEEPTAKCVVSTKRKQYNTIPDAELLAEIGRRVRSTREYLTEFETEDPTFDPLEDIYNYSVEKLYSGADTLREVGDKGWLDKPQPRRTDMESVAKGMADMVDAVEFIDIEIEPGDL